MGKFKPEYAGKMNFYFSAVDDTIIKGSLPTIDQLEAELNLVEGVGKVNKNNVSGEDLTKK